MTYRAAVVVLLAMMASGCADEPGPPPQSRVSITASPTVPGGLRRAPTGQPTKEAGRQVTATGRVSEGVESGCRLLSSGGVIYELHGAAVRDLRLGERIEVEGRVDDGMRSTCQQGTILTVTKVRRR